MTNCERCCFYEHCTKTGQSKDKNCVYGKKTKEIGGTTDGRDKS